MSYTFHATQICRSERIHLTNTWCHCCLVAVRIGAESYVGNCRLHGNNHSTDCQDHHVYRPLVVNVSERSLFLSLRKFSCWLITNWYLFHQFFFLDFFTYTYTCSTSIYSFCTYTSTFSLIYFTYSISSAKIMYINSFWFTPTIHDSLICINGCCSDWLYSFWLRLLVLDSQLPFWLT